MIRLLVAAVLVVGICTPAASQTESPDAVSKTELRSLAPAKAKRRVLEQLSGALEPPEFQRAYPPTRPLRAVWMATRPRAASYPGLCRADSLTVEFEPVADEPTGPETPVEAAGVQARRSYHLLERPPAFEPERLAPAARRSLDRLCARRKLWQDDFFEAEDEKTAQRGGFLLHAALDAVRANAATPGFACTLAEAKSPTDCAARLLRLRLDLLEDVERCEQLPDEPYTATCIKLFIDDHDLRIRHDDVSGRIAAVELKPVLVMRHEAMD